ncbi:MAG: alpha/beta fold hydrolase [Acidimicrobiia bacterium]
MTDRITIDVNGPVSVLDHGGEGPLVVFVHGLEGSAYNWSLLAPHIAETHRAVAPDLSGFGYTPPAGRGSTVEENAELVADIIKRYGDDALLIGNSMGGLISLIVADKHPDLVRGVVLINPAAPVTDWGKVSPTAAARLSTPLIPLLGGSIVDAYRSTQTPEQGAEEALHFVAVDATSIDPIVWRHAEEIARLRRTQDWPTDSLVAAVRSIAPYVLRKPTFAKLLHRIAPPVLLIHGTEDDLIQVESARWIGRERPDWTTVLFDGVGHVPMLETPEKVLDVFDVWEQAAFGTPAAAP